MDTHEEEYPDDAVIQAYLEQEGCVIVPLDFINELLTLMKEHIMRETGVSEEVLHDCMTTLNDLIGEDGMYEMSVEETVNWVRTLSQIKSD